MYGMYGSYGSVATQAGVGLVLAFIAFIAAIVVTVIFYRKFISVDNVYKTPGVKGDWGPFFRFEHLIIENILKVLYIFTASLIAFECAASIITSFFAFMYDAGAAFGGIIFFLILFVVLEIINRLWFEFSLLTVLIWKNTSAIRKSVAADDTSSNAGGYNPFNPVIPQPGNASQNAQSTNSGTSFASGVSSAQAGSPSVSAQPTQPVAQPAQPVAQPTQPVSASAVSSQPSAASQVSTQNATVQAPVSPSDASQAAPVSHSHNAAWTCPSCGAFNKSGSFCAQCGTRRNN